jgi:hypothetical protein
MKRITLSLLFIFFGCAIHAQEAAEVVPSFKRKAIYSLTGSFTDLSNWNAGGENSSNFSALLRENWKKNGSAWTQVHLLEGNYGIARQAGVYTKNADKLEWTTTVTGSPANFSWNISAQANVKTQFAPGYAAGDTSKTAISSFGAPIYGQYSLGAGSTSFEHWEVFISPLSIKSTTVLDPVLSEKGSFGVLPGEQWRFEGGAKVTLNYAQEWDDQWSVVAKSDVFMSYFNPISTTDISLDVIVLYKLKQFLTLSGQVQLVRDLDMVELWQRRSVAGIGLAYQIQ